MELKVIGTPKEIAELVAALQARPNDSGIKNRESCSGIRFVVRDDEPVEEKIAALTDIITRARKNYSSTSSI